MRTNLSSFEIAAAERDGATDEIGLAVNLSGARYRAEETLAHIVGLPDQGVAGGRQARNDETQPVGCAEGERRDCMIIRETTLDVNYRWCVGDCRTLGEGAGHVIIGRVLA